MLPDPDNGMVTLTGTSPGDTATYNCDDGYVLDGEQVLICQSNGWWDSDPSLCIPSTTITPPGTIYLCKAKLPMLLE